MKRYPTQIKNGKGTIKNKSSYYKGFSIALKTIVGEVVLVACCLSELKEQASFLMPRDFIVDESEIKEVCIFSANRLDKGN